ncbi:MAG: hypothetical protein PVF33_08340 [Candidatus Latescibacterota bacterium]|jgi:hypothetical protein
MWNDLGGYSLEAVRDAGATRRSVDGDPSVPGHHPPDGVGFATAIGPTGEKPAPFTREIGRWDISVSCIDASGQGWVTNDSTAEAGRVSESSTQADRTGTMSNAAMDGRGALKVPVRI